MCVEGREEEGKLESVVMLTGFGPPLKTRNWRESNSRKDVRRGTERKLKTAYMCVDERGEEGKSGFVMLTGMFLR